MNTHHTFLKQETLAQTILFRFIVCLTLIIVRSTKHVSKHGLLFLSLWRVFETMSELQGSNQAALERPVRYCTCTSGR